MLFFRLPMLVVTFLVLVRLVLPAPCRAQEPVDEPSVGQEPASHELTRDADQDAEREAFRRQLEELASRCDELQLPEEARITRQWYLPRDPQRQYLFLPAAADPLAPAADAPRLKHFWYRKFREIRAQRAARLMDQARRWLSRQRGDLAYQALHEVLRQDPDHAQARQTLGFRKQGEHWSRPEAELRVRSGERNHPQFGWRRRRYWIVDSEHYQIQTSHSPQAGQELAELLERLHQVWQQAFFDFWSSPEPLARRLDGQNVPLGPARRHQVVLFRDRAEYVGQLRQSEPGIEKSIGYYASRNRTAYFYWGQQDQQATWHHEAAHQLFQESLDAVVDPGAEDNFWIVEGAALYMESLRPREGYVILGGWDSRRLQYARYRALNERFQVPLDQLVGYGRQRLQQDDDIRRLYSQAAGLAHFLLDFQGGRYRRTTIEYLKSVYQGQATRDSLATRAGVPLDHWDVQYRQYLNVRDDDLAWLDEPSELGELCLGHTEVTDQGLRVLSNCRQLQWLDLAFTAAGDASVERLAGSRLRQLNLERSRITDAALDTIAGLPALEELDLSGTAISDAGVRKLASQRELTVLWLTGTQITDESLEPLAGLKKLTTLDVSGTRMTADGWNRLKQQLPQLDSRIE